MMNPNGIENKPIEYKIKSYRGYMKYALILTFLLFTSCAHQGKKDNANPQTPFLVATKYFQNSAEAAALYEQGYNVAYLYVQKVMKNYKEKLPACVVLDIDETVLNNSYYQGTLYEKGETYRDETWDEWVNLAKAPALPGVVSYISKVRDLGVEPIFITNRRSYLLDKTIENLEKVGIPTEKKFMVGRDKVHSKEVRRALFKNSCHIIQLIGDNLSDFSDDYNAQEMKKRKQQVSKKNEFFGTRYILLPNPMYGDWRKTILDYPLKSIDSLRN